SPTARQVAVVGVESIGAPAWSPDRRWLAVSNRERVLLYRADGTPQRRWVAHPSSQISSLGWSPDSRWLVSAADDRTVRFWRPDGTAGPVLASPHLNTRRLAWSCDGRLATISYTGMINVWRLEGSAVRPLWLALPIDGDYVAIDATGRLLLGSDDL